jgi:hypothetical protein
MGQTQRSRSGKSPTTNALGLRYGGVGANATNPFWLVPALRRAIRVEVDAQRSTQLPGARPVDVAGPGAAIYITVLRFNLLGDGLSDALDPKNQHEKRCRDA